MHGDCNVLREWAEDPRLGRWVHKQRTSKKALDRGEPSEAMTAARAAKLEALGFSWDTRWDAEWASPDEGRGRRSVPPFCAATRPPVPPGVPIAKGRGGPETTIY